MKKRRGKSRKKETIGDRQRKGRVKKIISEQLETIHDPHKREAFIGNMSREIGGKKRPKIRRIRDIRTRTLLENT